MEQLSLKDTVELMNSKDYKERFIAEYLQTKIRYEKLKKFNTKIEAARELNISADTNPDRSLPREKYEEPIHDCSARILREQQSFMGEYLHILEVRAEMEGITLPGVF